MIVNEIHTKAVKLSPVPVGVEVIERVLSMAGTLPFGTACCVILFRPCTLNAITACHAQVPCVCKGAMQLAFFSMSVYV